MLRTAKPKLSLAVPTTAIAAPKSPFPIPISPNPMSSPTARNTMLNQRGFSTLQQPTFNYQQAAGCKGILKRSAVASAQSKKISFSERPTITCVSPMPEDYHGQYVKMSRDEKRWARS